MVMIVRFVVVRMICLLNFLSLTFLEEFFESWKCFSARFGKEIINLFYFLNDFVHQFIVFPELFRNRMHCVFSLLIKRSKPKKGKSERKP